MLEKLKEFKDTLSERVKSPFIGSLIITWSLIHWKIFAFFIFEQGDLTFSERISNIEEYISTKGFSGLFVWPILITLGVLVVYGVLNAIGLIIKLLYDNWASPIIQSKLYNTNIIEKPKYEKLKRELSAIKKKYDEDKENYFNSEKESREIKNHFESFKSRSFEGAIVNDITGALTKDVEWENFHTYPDGRTGSEIFKTDLDGFQMPNGMNIKIDNIKITPNGKILAFDKIIDGEAHNNYLIRDNDFNYHGIEDENIRITYRRKTVQNIKINSANYRSEGNFIEVTELIQKIVDRKLAEFQITNETMKGDPGHGKPKNLDISYALEGVQFRHVVPEGAKLNVKQELEDAFHRHVM